VLLSAGGWWKVQRKNERLTSSYYGHPFRARPQTSLELWLARPIDALRFEKLHIAGVTRQLLPIHATFVIGKNEKVPNFRLLDVVEILVRNVRSTLSVSLFR
jgi:hypothetical protein